MNLLEKDRSIRDLDRSKQKIGEELDFAAREAYNLLKTNIEFSLTKRTDNFGYAIGITSSCPQEGKSYTSINLAYSFAVDGHKVLLIDGDMRRPSVAASLNVESVPGLANILASTNATGVIESTHKGVLHENLDVILSGTIPPNASKLIRSEEFKNLIDEFRKQYDFIILDLPPVNSVSDPIGVSQYIDGLILVIKHDYTRRRDAHEAIRQLKYVNANLIGIIYNGYSRSSGYYYRKHRSYYRHDYYYQSSETPEVQNKNEAK
ncbi:CpsD/CapB family tyrosine-protein kinase [bacterium]|nr:CpsD/CapB family tyrosine-protein kinase [bacterium]